MIAKFYLRSGHVIDIQCSEITTARNSRTGEFQEYEIMGMSRKSVLNDMDMREIVAVVVVHDEDEREGQP